MHIYYNLNPDQNLVGDCVVRAIGKLTDMDWDTTYLKICIQGLLMHELQMMMDESTSARDKAIIQKALDELRK